MKPFCRLIDLHKRHLNYLRVSITDRCNLACVYCTPAARPPKYRHADILRYEEILRLVRVGVQLGITKVRVTGGEPLARKGVDAFLAHLGSIPGLMDISLTTNGILLADHLARLKTAGVRRINISLDTLNRAKYRQITGVDAFERVWHAIEAAEEAGFHPIKLNVVALKGINDDELTDLARLSITKPYHVRFIEYMPIGDARADTGRRILAPDIQGRIAELGELTPVQNDINDGPARRFKFKDARGEVGLIMPLSNHFCAKCNRLRLTAVGHLRTCLLSDTDVDIKGPLRTGATDDELAQIFLEATRHKPSAHEAAIGRSINVNGQMCRIGG